MEDALDNKNLGYDPAKEAKPQTNIKKRKTKKLNTILKKEPRIMKEDIPKERKLSIKWDKEVIESQITKKKGLKPFMNWEKRRIEKEKEDEKRKKDQEELENLLKQRQQIEKEQNNKNNNYNYQNNDYNRNNNNYNQNNKRLK